MEISFDSPISWNIIYTANKNYVLNEHSMMQGTFSKLYNVRWKNNIKLNIRLTKIKIISEVCLYMCIIYTYPKRDQEIC